MRGIMQRALQQARAEALAQAQGASTQAPGQDAMQQETEASAVAMQTAGNAAQIQQPLAGSNKKALGALLRRAAQNMQQQDRAGISGTVVTQAAGRSLQDPSAQQESLSHLDESRAHAPEHDLQIDPAAVRVGSSLSQPPSESSSTDLLLEASQPSNGPARGQSLGQKLGSMLRNALSMPRQGSYTAVSGIGADGFEVFDEGVEGSSGGPGAQRALPRDASYLPEWLNRTLQKGAVLGSSSSSRRSSLLSQGSAVSEADSTESMLPQWVDISTLQQSELSRVSLAESGPVQTAPQQGP